jgi:hypothetical protein
VLDRRRLAPGTTTSTPLRRAPTTQGRCNDARRCVVSPRIRTLVAENLAGKLTCAVVTNMSNTGCSSKIVTTDASISRELNWSSRDSILSPASGEKRVDGEREVMRTIPTSGLLSRREAPQLPPIRLRHRRCRQVKAMRCAAPTSAAMPQTNPLRMSSRQQTPQAPCPCAVRVKTRLPEIDRTWCTNSTASIVLPWPPNPVTNVAATPPF